MGLWEKWIQGRKKIYQLEDIPKETSKTDKDWKTQNIQWIRNICIMRWSEREEKGKEKGKIFGQQDWEFSQINIRKQTQIQAAWRKTSRINTKKKITPRYLPYKPQKTKDTKILKRSEEKKTTKNPIQWNKDKNYMSLVLRNHASKEKVEC